MSSRLSAFETGIVGLDTILGGGLSHASLVFITGMSGAGKTVLGAQVMFNAARRGERGLILTGFSEGHVKLLEHLSSFSFFDRTVVGNELTLLSLQTLVGQDPDAAAAALLRASRQTDARLVLIDGIHTLRALLPSNDHALMLLATLANQLTYLDITLIVTIDAKAQDIHTIPEMTLADVVIALDYTLDGWRRIWRLEVLKQRGRKALDGLHSFEISSDGITLYPRLEALSVPAATNPVQSTVIPFGLAELDALLNGGLPGATSTLLVGPRSTGKTALALTWALRSASHANPTLFVSFTATAPHLMRFAEVCGVDVGTAVEQDGLQILSVPLMNMDPDRVAHQLLTIITTHAIQHVVIDDLDALWQRLGERTSDYLVALRAWFKQHGVTAIFTLQSSHTDGFGVDLVSTLFTSIAENVIVLQHQIIDQQPRRTITVQGVAFQRHNPGYCEVILDESGLQVLPPRSPHHTDIAHDAHCSHAAPDS